MTITIAIDGPAAAGKGTISKAVAARFGYGHLDTGLLYRAVGARVLDGESPLEAAENLRPEDLTREDLRSADAARSASQVAALPDVRAALVDFQRAFARRQGGAVLDGRDIGTVICPEAEVKLFVTASDAVRADRRYREMAATGAEVTPEGVLADLRERDARDSARATAPLKPAEDAVVLDTSEMEIGEAVAQAVAVIEAAIASTQMRDDDPA
ncbi:(d)CMP kinase [Pseudooceanicola algae]|uniref:Cytidylate kinase n=1 Tax=Pseudooceanicola algae TaxID=1537215 RepID=A0A418SJM6_9RHOB|nr:d(CMP) kinase [Pseudooceanicola algae]QPM91933.1 Cytidylate kinase [Pseudooceanicola algae]